MDQLLDFLGTLRDRPLGTVVYVGAGNGLALDLRRWEALAPESLLLVEGDPETAAELERHVGHLPWALVRALAVAPQAGPLRWQRYNLDRFNGPVDATPLQTYYPRLRTTETRDRPALAFADLLSGAPLGKHLNVLAMDVPGQEAALLAAVPVDLLSAFDCIAMRGCRQALAGEHSSAEFAPHRLQRHAFRKKLVDENTQPLWPVTLMRFDAGRHKLQQLELELAAARDVQQQREARIVELESAYADLLTQARNAERRTAEHLQQVQQLNRTSDADAALLAERDAQIADLTRQCRALDAALGQKTAASASLQAELDAARGDLAAARGAGATAAQQAGEQQLAAQQAQQEKAAAEQRLQEAERQLLVVTRQAQTLEQQVHQLESTQTRQVVRHQMLQDELHRAEGQIDLIKDLLLGDGGL